MSIRTLGNNFVKHLSANWFFRSYSKLISLSKMKIVTIPVLSDNYSYLVIDEKDKIALAVDPSVAATVLEAAEKEKSHYNTYSYHTPSLGPLRRK